VVATAGEKSPPRTKKPAHFLMAGFGKPDESESPRIPLCELVPSTIAIFCRSNIMTFARSLWLVAAFALLSTATLRAGEVKIDGVHICCGQCVTIAQNTLKKVDGVSNAKADKDAGAITLTAADDKAAAAAIDALAKAGFRGNAKHGDKSLAFPGSNAEKGAKSDKLAITGVHLCCKACYSAAEDALKGVAGVSTVSSDKSTKTLEVLGKDVDQNAALEALFKAGFQASVKK
jgi:copper chaperone CopZ